MNGNVYVKNGSFMYKYFELTYDAYKRTVEYRLSGNEAKARECEIVYNSNRNAIDTLELMLAYNAFVEAKRK